MKLAGIFFSSDGEALAKRLQTNFEGQVSLFSKKNYKENLNRIFEDFSGIVFFSSIGIAVRLSAPFIKNKTVDPAIVVVDDMGRYAISLLSGHLGGANELAERTASILGCSPIITTASDGRGFEAVDLFAVRNGLVINCMDRAKQITAMMVEGKKIGLRANYPIKINYPNLDENEAKGWIYVTSRIDVNCDKPFVLLHPKVLNVGIGCKRGKSKDSILSVLRHVFQEHHLSLSSIKSISSIELKKDELGLLEACRELNQELKIFTADAIISVQDRFTASSFVSSIVGVTGVCEPCAFLAGGEIIVPKTASDGVTIAVAEEESP